MIKTTNFKWNWKGPVHNYVDLLEHKGKATHEYLSDDLVYIHVNYHEGAKSHGVTNREKYMRDAKLLLDDLADNPADPTRSQFYLGQSYYDAEEWKLASKAYQKRIKMGGWQEEVFFSKYR